MNTTTQRTELERRRAAHARQRARVIASLIAIPAPAKADDRRSAEDPSGICVRRYP
jgi:hypothetical protein